METNKAFALAPDAVPQAVIPRYTLSDNTRMPCIGYGTFGSDHAAPEEVAENVKNAFAVGYRALDCAAAYSNEGCIGATLQEVFSSGVLSREEVHITSKLPNDRHGAGEVLLACAQTLRDLCLDYLDLYLIHWPFPNFHPPGCDTHQRDPDAWPFFAEEYLAVWQQMEKLVDMGLVRSIGMSNMTIPKIESVYGEMRIKPVVNEVELHPHLQQPELLAYLREKDILPIAYTPLGSPNRPERDRTPEDTNCLEDPVLHTVASNHGIHPATVCIKWAAQRGTLPIPFSASRGHILGNLKCCTEDPLTEVEMAAIAQIDAQCRLIKGTVLLWEGAPDWRSLWDLEGKIDRCGWKG